MQTKTGSRGNCFTACLASLFEISIEDVPNFYDEAGDDAEKWWGAVRDWLRIRGFGLMNLELKDDADLSKFEGYFLVSGKSARGIDHETIWKGGRMVHDPHPSGCGLKTIQTVEMIYPLDPSRMVMKT